MNSAVHRSADSELSRDPIDAITALEFAIKLAYQAGFTRAFISRKTESCYFKHQGRPGVLMRLSMHKNSKSPIGMDPVVARAAFAPTNSHLSLYMVWNTMRFVIGDYFLRPAKPSSYRGRRGTWENNMSKSGDKILAGAREALAVTRGDIATIEKIRVTPSCGCVFCDLNLELHEDSGGFHHVSNGETALCTRALEWGNVNE